MALCKGGITWNIKPDSPFFKKIHSSQPSSTGGEVQATNHRNSASSEDMFKQLKEQIRDELREEVKATFTEQVFEEMLATALSLKNDWEEKMNSIRRIGVRLNEHGQDEVYEYPLPLGKVEACMSIAAEVVRRADPTNTVIQKCYAPDANQILDLELELEEFDSVISYMRKQRKSYASPPEFSLTYNVCIKACLSLRAETVRFLLSHPFYVIAGDNLKKVIRQEYIHFFDRVFTSQMVDLMGIVSLWFEGDCDILKLPADQLFNECEGLVTGGNDHMGLKERNRRTLTSYN